MATSKFTSRRCFLCKQIKFRVEFSLEEWLKDGICRCSECFESWRTCGACNLWNHQSYFTDIEWRKPLVVMIFCKNCVSTRVCYTCHQLRGKLLFSNKQWLQENESKCLDCETRTLKPLVNYQIGQPI